MGKYDDALASYAKQGALLGHSEGDSRNMASLYAAMGNADEARRLVGPRMDRWPEVHVALGDKDTARHSRNQTCRAVSSDQRWHERDTNALATICRKNKLRRVSVTAFSLLFKSVDKRQSEDWPLYVMSDPQYERLHGDPRWNELLVRMNFVTN